MNYENLYKKIIDRAKIRIANFEYVEKHHIIPKCLGGNNCRGNIAILSAREHFICHYLLTKIYPDNKSLCYAFWGMCNQKNKRVNRNYKISSRLYEKARLNFSKNFSGEDHPNFGKKFSIERSEKISKKLKGENHPNFGKSLNAKWYLLLDINNSEFIIRNLHKFKKENPNKTFKKFPDKQKNIHCKPVDFRFIVLKGYNENLSENDKQTIIQTHKNLIKSIGPIIPWNKGIKTDEQTKKKLSMALKGRKPWNTGLKLRDYRD